MKNKTNYMKNKFLIAASFLMLFTAAISVAQEKQLN